MARESFSDFEIDETIIKAIKAIGYSEPTDVQKTVIPMIIQSKDLVVKSKTGSGKTAAYAIPLCQITNIEQKEPQALVLTPTRELAVQTKEDITNIGRYKRIRCAAIFGKQPMEIQVNELRQRVHIIVGTPGRVLDHISKGSLNTEKIRHLVIDEADEMLSMGFIKQMEDILERLPKDRVTMLFSATLPKEIEELCHKYIKDFELVEINKESLIVDKVKQVFYEVLEEEKLRALERILYIYNPDSCMIFCKTKDNVDEINEWMNKRAYPCYALHGGMDQNLRLEIMKKFKRGEFRFLISTDVAARGIDVEEVNLVINYDVPVEKERYVHRIGRTARAGKTGEVVSLVTDRESKFFEEIQNYIDFDIPKDKLPSFDECSTFKEAFKAKNIIRTKVKKDKGDLLTKGITKLYIGLGRDKKIRAGDIVGAITSIEGVNAENIGVIDVQNRFSYVEILDGKGYLVLEALKKTKIKGKVAKVEIADK